MPFFGERCCVAGLLVDVCASALLGVACSSGPRSFHDRWRAGSFLADVSTSASLFIGSIPPSAIFCKAPSAGCRCYLRAASIVAGQAPFPGLLVDVCDKNFGARCSGARMQLDGTACGL